MLKYLINILNLWLLAASLAFAQQPAEIKSLELPKITKRDVIIKHTGYTLSYNEQHEQANWVAYELTAEETHKSFERTNKFIPDPDVSTGSATDADYRSSGYDRGHLAPAADMGWSETTMRESFYFSNMSPQVPAFNRGIWKELEEQVRQWAIDNRKIYVVTGPILENNLPTIGENHVSVPKAYYKVILDYTEPGLKGIGFIIPNAASSKPVSTFAIPIDSVEKVARINFFPALPDEQERAIEKSVCLSCWSWDTKASRSNNSSNQFKENFSKSSGEKVQCHGTTKACKRCKNMTRNPSGYCPHHEWQRGQ